MTDKTSENFALDCNDNKIFVGDKVKRVKDISRSDLKHNETYEVSDIICCDEIALKDIDGFWYSDNFEVQKEYNKEYNKEYRLAIFDPDSPIIIACNGKEFQEEFEKYTGFVKWLTEWTEW